ncbi:hypothetical protein GOP47_0025297 [Adiantum capillus-veneris]|uniref:Cytochrome P450 n=1 Tax=Adiantum capillus-veneris TaxID=13818 RepID=A0A9D4U0F2_ADICA|nr:hypothetical protein GOP47_0025297 [Adiantum capillus-veneris]
MAELLNQQERKAMKRLAEELGAAMSMEARGIDEEEQLQVRLQQQVDEGQLARLPYLEAVMKESLRLHPPASTLLPHFCKEETEVAGYRVPAKSMVVVNAWGMGRDESVWENAHLFQPERFVAGGPDSHIMLGGPSNYQLLAFGRGWRGCPGRNLGLTMASLVVANLVHSFNWDIDHGASTRR